MEQKKIDRINELYKKQKLKDSLRTKRKNRRFFVKNIWNLSG